MHHCLTASILLLLLQCGLACRPEQPCKLKLLPCRVGRTARAGRRGWSLSFVTQYDIELVQQIEVGVWLTALSAACQAVLARSPDGNLPCNCIQT